MREGGQGIEISDKTAREANQPGHLERLAPTDFNFNITVQTTRREEWIIW